MNGIQNLTIKCFTRLCSVCIDAFEEWWWTVL